MAFRMVIAGAALLGSVSAQAAPSDVNAQAFYADAKALEAKGVTAMFDKRLKPMVAQMKDAGLRAKAANEAGKGAGKPLYCPPANLRQSMGAQQVVAMIGRVPENERRSMTLAAAWQRALVREYPCQ